MFDYGPNLTPMFYDWFGLRGMKREEVVALVTAMQTVHGWSVMWLHVSGEMRVTNFPQAEVDELMKEVNDYG